MKEDVYLSIIIPVYNVIDHLDKCVDSITLQNNELVEAIFVNDGSTDGSDLYLESRCSGKDNIKVINKNNGGISSARNVGINEARGKYICLLDSDDALSMGSLQKVISCLKKNEPDVLMVDYIRTWVDGGVYYRNPSKNFISNKLLDVEKSDVVSKVYDDSELYPWKFIFKSAIYKKNLFIEGVSFEDIRSIPLLISSSKTFLYTPIIFIRYLQRQGSTVNTKNIKNVIDLSSSTILFKEKHDAKTAPSQKTMLSHDVFSMKVFIWSIQDLISSDATNHTIGNYRILKNNLEKSLFNEKRKVSFNLKANDKKMYFLYKMISKETFFKILLIVLKKPKISLPIIRAIYRKI